MVPVMKRLGDRFSWEQHLVPNMTLLLTDRKCGVTKSWDIMIADMDK